MTAPAWFILTRSIQNPIGAGPSGRIGGFRESLGNFGGLLQQNPGEVVLVVTFLIVALWLVRQSGSH